MDDGHEHLPDEKGIAALLQRVRPVGPPAELRARVVRLRAVPPAWPWAAAAAALLALLVGLPVWTARLADTALPSAGAANGPVRTLADLLGGDEEAQRAARLIVAAEQMRAHRDGTALTGQLAPVQP